MILPEPLAGVTVGTASPVLPGNARTAVTDGTDSAHRRTAARPLRITLPERIQRSQTAGCRGDGAGCSHQRQMRVGAVAETITVTGETPVVDTQSARRQNVLSNDIINTLPATRTYGALLAAVPGLQVQGNGSAATTPFMAMFTANGGRANEGRILIDGLSAAAPLNGGGVSTFTYDVANAQEMQVSVSGNLGDAENGGPQVNLVPKSGGNTFKGSAFYSDAGRWSTGNNLNDTLRGYGLTQPAGVISSWDTSAVWQSAEAERLWPPTFATTAARRRFVGRSATSTPVTRRSDLRRIRTQRSGRRLEAHLPARLTARSRAEPRDFLHIINVVLRLS